MELIMPKELNHIQSMSVMDAIYHRRSEREYLSKTVDDDTIKKLIDATIQAPSAINEQPWGFVIVQDMNLLRSISNETKEMIKKNPKLSFNGDQEKLGFKFMLDDEFNIFYNASTLIIICASSKGFSPTEDCYLAGENLMLAACGMGLGTCTIGFALSTLQKAEYKEKLGIPEDYKAVLPIIVGYPSNTTPKSVNRNPPLIFKWIKKENLFQ